MTAKEINERMAQDEEGLCRRLLPGGKKVGNHWCAGSIRGEEGDSLKVVLDGTKAGVWCDFANDTDKGDLIDLVAAVQGCSMAEAIKFGKEWCRITEPVFTAPSKAKKVQPIAPLSVKTVSSEGMAWLKNRGLSEFTINAYRVVASGTTVAFPCYLGDDLYHTKYRDTALPKERAFRTSEKSTPILFGWQVVPKNARTIVITEGEMDAMSYFEQGIPAMSVPMGAGTGNKQQWLELDYERLEPFDTIFISMDMDEAGQATFPYLANRLGLHRCRIVNLPLKDANECLAAGHSLQTYLDAAKTIDPVELKKASDFLDEVEEQFRPTKDTHQGCVLPWRYTEDKFRIRPGELTVWTGFNGSGKSMVLSHVAVELARQDEKVCIASMEMAPPVTLKRMYQQAGAVDIPTQQYLLKIDDWFDGKLWIVNIRGTAKADRLLEIFRYAWKRYGVTQIVIDSLLKCGFAEDDYNGQKQFVDKLCDFIAETKCHIHLVSHARKLENEFQLPGKMDVRGGSALTDLPDNVITVWRNKPKEEAAAMETRDNGILSPETQRKPDAILQLHKQRHFDWEGKICLWYDKVSHQYLPEHGVNPMPYV